MAIEIEEFDRALSVLRGELEEMRQHVCLLLRRKLQPLYQGTANPRPSNKPDRAAIKFLMKHDSSTDFKEFRSWLRDDRPVRATHIWKRVKAGGKLEKVPKDTVGEINDD